MENTFYIVGIAFLAVWGLWWCARHIMRFSYDAGIEANDEVVVLFVESTNGWYNVRDHEDNFIVGGDDIRELAEKATGIFSECRKLLFVVVGDGYVDEVNRKIADAAGDGIPKAVIFVAPITAGESDDAI